MFKIKNHKKALFVLTFILILKATWAIFSIKSGYISLDPDEAQYWNWSQNLDFGYYSKPPGIALQIWAGCKLFGQTELGVRFVSVILSILSAFSVYLLAYYATGYALTCLISALVFALCPIGFMGTFAATTDVGFILFWILALCPLFRALSQNERPNYYLIGFFILLGALFKWPIYILWPLILIATVFDRKTYHKSLWYGVAISMLGFLPSIIWNFSHEWATFKHVFTQSTTVASKANFGSFFSAQIAILSPIFFALMILSTVTVIKRRKMTPKALKYAAFITNFILIVYCLLACVKKMQPNWAIFAYPTSALIIGWYIDKAMKKGLSWFGYGLALSFFMVATVITVPYLQNQNGSASKFLPYKFNAFRHSIGWSNLKKEMHELNLDANDNFLCSDSYQVASLIGFYGPTQKRQYFLNVSGRRKNQFSFWPSLAQEKTGKSGYFIYADNAKDFMANIEHRKDHMRKKIAPYFDTVEVEKVVPLFEVNQKVVKGAIIFKCTHYNGKAPIDQNNY